MGASERADLLARISGLGAWIMKGVRINAINVEKLVKERGTGFPHEERIAMESELADLLAQLEAPGNGFKNFGDPLAVFVAHTSS